MAGIVFLLALLGGGAYALFSEYLRESSGEQLTELVGNYLPNTTIQYDSVDVNLSLDNVQAKAKKLTISNGGHRIAADTADFRLSEEGVNITLYSPAIFISGAESGNEIAADRANFQIGNKGLNITLHAPAIFLGDVESVSDIGYVLSTIIPATIVADENPYSIAVGAGAVAPFSLRALPATVVANDTRIVISDILLTLDNANITVRVDSGGWTMDIEDASDRLRLRMRERDDHLRLHAEIDNYPLPSTLTALLGWSDAHMTISATIADTIHYNATGLFEDFRSDHLSLTVQHATWGSEGIWHASTMMQFTVSLGVNDVRAANATLHGATIDAVLQLQDNDWTAQNGYLKMHGVSLTLQTDFQASVQLTPGCDVAFSDCVAHAAARFNAHGYTPLPYATSVMMTVHSDGFWYATQDYWKLTLSTLHFASNDESAMAMLSIYANATLTTFAARGSVAAMNLAAIARYMPDGEVRQWIVESLLAGVVQQAAFTLYGDTRPGQVTLFADAAFADGVLNIADGWQPATNLTGVFRLRGEDIIITGGGVFDELPAPDVIARIPDINADRSTLFLNINGAQTPLSDLVAVANRTPATRDIMRGVNAALSTDGGRGALTLGIVMPLAQPESSRVDGRLDVRHVGLYIDDLPPFQSVAGNVQFDNDGYWGALDGRIQGQPAHTDRLQAVFDTETLTVRGEVETGLLLAAAGLPDAPISGVTPFLIARTEALTVFSSTLDGTVIDLPYPLGKGARKTALLTVEIANGGARARIENNDVTIYVNTHGGTEIGINTTARAAPAEGINLRGNASDLNLDLWLAQGGGGGNFYFSTIQLTLKQSDVMGIANSVIIASGGSGSKADALTLRVNADIAAGNLILSDYNVRGDFSYLSISFDDDEKMGSDSDVIESTTVNIAADTFILSDITLGALALAGAPHRDQWLLSNLQVSNDSVTLRMQGAYEKNYTFLTVRLRADMLSTFMTQLQLPPVFGQGRLSLYGGIGWPGTPADFQLSSTGGNIRLFAQEVQYLDTDANSGVVNLLAIFSPQSLLELGFTELGSGLTFDSVVGDIELKDGAALLNQPIRLASRDILIDIEGSTNFVNRQHDLRGSVRPGEKILHAGAAVSIGAGLLALNPASLAATTLFGKIFEQPIASIGSYDYTITGPWDDPKYVEIGVSEENTQ